MINLKYSEILRLNSDLGKSLTGAVYNVTVLSNIIVSQLSDILEFGLRSEAINAHVTSGDYDNILQDAVKYDKSDLCIIFWEAANLIDGLQYKAEMMSASEIEKLIHKLCSEIDFVVKGLENSSLIIVNKFSSLLFNHNNLRSNNFDLICLQLNSYLEKKAKSNLVLIDIDKVIAKISISKSADFRYYYSSKALYTVEFYKNYVQYIIPVINSVNGRSKKALIFDCDNTLWKGIIGEDDMNAIEMSAKTKAGVVFEEIQYLAMALSKRGVIIGLCSKNNAGDVENILQNHPDISIKTANITIKKINWNDKVENIREISKDLNIGRDSLVFVDDSDFELDFVQTQLPEVKTIKVPSNLYEYPQLIRESGNLFYFVSETKEDGNRTKMYKDELERVQERSAFESLDSYLRSLELKLTIYRNPQNITARLSQLTQKTNQFNLTTKRYTETDIDAFINDQSYSVFCFKVEDKHGDSGITGLAIIEQNADLKTASIDSLLMSCRVIGRNIEIVFFEFIVNYLKTNGIELILAKYVKSFKNSQVERFYENRGFTVIEESGEERQYEMIISNYLNTNINYIKIIHGTED